MTINIDIKDRHGKNIELNQDVALKVYRRSGNYSNWHQRININHFKYFWIKGKFIFYEKELQFKLDEESRKALEQPIDKEREKQLVDYYNAVSVTLK